MTVLDASAVLALIHDEPGAEAVADAIGGGGASLSSVNLAEVATSLTTHAVPRAKQIVAALLRQVEVVSFDEIQALSAGRLVEHTGRHGLGLGDRACLALARERREPVLTADRAWADLPRSVGVEIRLVR